MKLNLKKILSGLSLGILLAVAACGSNSAPAPETPPQGNAGDTQPPPAQNPQTALKPSEFIVRMLKLARDLSDEKLANVYKCPEFSSNLTQIDSLVPEGSQGSRLITATASGCDDSSHFGSNASIGLDFQDYIENNFTHGFKLNGLYSMNYQDSDSSFIIKATSTNFNYNGKSYNFENVEMDDVYQQGWACKGTVKVDDKTCTVSQDCQSCKFPLPNIPNPNPAI